MKTAIKKGFGFGLTSGIITTLGMMIGLNMVTHSKVAVLAGILVIAITDALSDAVAIFMADETSSHKEVSIWQESISLFISKLVVGFTFALPVIFLDLNLAVSASVIYGLVLLLALSYFIAKNDRHPILKLVISHLLVAILVIIISAIVGYYVEMI